MDSVTTYIQNMQFAFRLTNPWKMIARDGEGTYKDGWNDCLKELKKRQAEFIKNYDKYAHRAIEKTN